jgi:fatty-acyl-CoA synthase
VPTFADHVLARAADDRPGLLFEDHQWSYRQWVEECVARARLFESMRLDGPAHIGLLLENVPDFSMWLGAAALAGATIVGINPTRRGAELERDITYTECQLIVTETPQSGLLDGLDLGRANGRVLTVDAGEYAHQVRSHRAADAASFAPVPVVPEDIFLLLFTSGTSGTPKAVITTHGRLHSVSTSIIGLTTLTAEDVTYISMPLFHSNALFTAWGPSVVAGATIALRRTFSASGFLPDVRRFGATYFNYVGRPLAYVLATPEQADDADNPLRRGYGNEGSESDIARFAERFGCPLRDGYGQTETGASIQRVVGMPAGALGLGAPTISVRDPATGSECPPAVFDADGKLLNAELATGEIVNSTRGTFEGYWNNPEANAERLRDGAYWTGDLAYRDADGYFFFAGRNADWIRVDGENFSGAPIERIVGRFPGVVLAAAYAVPDPEIGDRVMVAIQLADGQPFDPVAFATFLAGQADLGPKWLPTYVRVVDDFPMTQTNKILKRELVTQQWRSSDPIWWRRGKEIAFVPFTPADRRALEAQFVERGRSNLLAMT